MVTFGRKKSSVQLTSALAGIEMMEESQAEVLAADLETALDDLPGAIDELNAALDEEEASE
jgi:hypothetical protein